MPTEVIEQDPLEKIFADTLKPDAPIVPSAAAPPTDATATPAPTAEVKPAHTAPRDESDKEKNIAALKKKHSDEQNEWKSKHETLAKTVAEREAEKATTAKERDEARAAARQYEAQFKAVAVEKSPEFKAKFDEPIKLSLAKISDRAGDRGKELTKLLSLDQSPTRDSEIAQLVSELPVFSQTLIANEVNRVDELRAGRNSEIARASQNWEAFEKEQNETRIRQADAQRQGWNQTLESTLSELGNPTTGIPLFQKRDGDADFNAAVDADMAAVKHLVNGNVAPRDMVKITALGVSARRLALQLQSTTTELAKAKEHIASLEAAGAKIGDFAKQGVNNDPNEDVMARIFNHAAAVGAANGKR